MVTASLDFVCIRPATYESAEEGQFLQTVFPARGSLENTVFCLFAPDGKTKLSASGRSPGMVFRSPERFLAELKAIAKRYPAKADLTRALPTVPDARLALNEAACDSAPLVVALADTQAELVALEARLAELAWSSDYVGRLHYTSATRAAAAKLEWLAGPSAKLGQASGLVVLEPNPFGTEAKLIAYSKDVVDSGQLAELLTRALDAHAPAPKNASRHIAEGRREGIEWESAIPVTDPDEVRRSGSRKQGN